MSGFQIADFDPRSMRRDGQRQVLTIMPNQVMKYMDDAEYSTPLGRLGGRISDWVSAKLGSDPLVTYCFIQDIAVLFRMSRTTRTFVAIAVPRRKARSCPAFRPSWRPSVPAAGWSTSPPFHLTLAFLGDVADET